MAQWVEQLTLGFGSSHELGVVGLSPVSQILSLSLSALLPRALSLSFSEK